MATEKDNSTLKARYKPGMHPNSRRNLRPFQPGNKFGKGRPTNEQCITNIVRKLLPATCEADKQKRTWMEVLAMALMTNAVKSPAFMGQLLDRIEGKVPLALTGAEGESLQANITFRVKSKAEQKLAEEIAEGKGLDIE